MRKNNFFQDDCWFNGTCDGLTAKKIQGQHLDLLSFKHDVSVNYEQLGLAFDYNLSGHFKNFGKFTHMSWPDVWNSNICEDITPYETPEFVLLYALIKNSISFTMADSKIKLISNFSVSGNTLFAGCNKPTTPYTALRTQSFASIISSTLDFRSLGEVFSQYLTNTKKINITEDEKFYYVYCIKKS